MSHLAVETRITGYTVCLDSMFQNSPLFRETGLCFEKRWKVSAKVPKAGYTSSPKKVFQFKRKRNVCLIRVSVKTVS